MKVSERVRRKLGTATKWFALIPNQGDRAETIEQDQLRLILDKRAKRMANLGRGRDV